MASGWNLWVGLECIVWLVGVVVRRYIEFLIGRAEGGVHGCRRPPLFWLATFNINRYILS